MSVSVKGLYSKLSCLLIGAGLSVSGLAPVQAQSPQPPYPDAKWNQEGCASISFKQLNLQTTVSNIADNLASGRIPADLKDEANALLEQNKSELEKQNKTFNSGCKGTYETSHVRSACQSLEKELRAYFFEYYYNDSFDVSIVPFCATLDGKETDGIKLVDDPVGMRQSIAWNFWGGINDKNISFYATPWTTQRGAETRKARAEDHCDMGLIANFSDAFGCIDKKESEHLADIADSMNPDMFAIAQPGIDGEAINDTRGAAALSVEMVRQPRDTVSESEIANIIALSDATRIPWDLGPYVQYPTLNFQARVYDILLEEPRAILQTVTQTEDGQLQRADISRAAAGSYDFGKTYFTSWNTWRVHSRFHLSPEDWTSVRAGNFGALVVTLSVIGEDGTPAAHEPAFLLTDFETTLQDFAASQIKVRDRMTEVAREKDQERDELNQKRDQAIAKAEIREEQKKQERVALVAEGLAKVEQLKRDWPVGGNCSLPTMIPARVSQAELDSYNSQSADFNQCTDNWHRRYLDYSSAAASLRNEYRQLGIGESTNEVWQAITEYKKVWRSKQTQFNDIVAQQARDSANRSSQMASNNRSSDTRTTRNEDNGPERDYASEFYFDQQNPPPTMFPYIPPPPRSTQYLSRGYD